MQRIHPAAEKQRDIAENKSADTLITSIENIAAAAEGFLFCSAQRRKLATAHEISSTAQDAAIFRIAEEMDDEVWDNLRQLSMMLAVIKSADIRDIRAKIRVWKSLAPESIFDEDEQTADEALLCSIIDEIEQLNLN